jgi:hypothetical protein
MDGRNRLSTSAEVTVAAANCTHLGHPPETWHGLCWNGGDPDVTEPVIRRYLDHEDEESLLLRDALREKRTKTQQDRRAAFIDKRSSTWRRHKILPDYP